MFNKDEEAQRLAEAHYQIEPGMREIYRLKGEPDLEVTTDEPIKLLEVNENTIASGVMPLSFAPSPADNVHFPTVVVEVTPDEFQQIRSNQLQLPHGWRIAELLPAPVQVVSP